MESTQDTQGIMRRQAMDDIIRKIKGPLDTAHENISKVIEMIKTESTPFSECLKLSEQVVKDIDLASDHSKALKEEIERGTNVKSVSHQVGIQKYICK